jgi:hypothetical protein
VKCSECADRCESLGHKIEIPRRDDVRAWEGLHQAWLEARRESQDARARADVQERHRREQELVKLAQRPDNVERQRLMGKLKRRLDEG